MADDRQRAEDYRTTKQLVLERVRATPLGALALGPVDGSGALTVTVARTLASDVTGRLEATPRAKDDSALIEGYQRIRNDLPDLDAVMGSGEDHRLVEVALAGGMVDLAAFARHIADLAERAAADLSREESDLIQNRIINDLASHISDRIAQATNDVERLNATLRKRAGRGLDTLCFHWEPHPEGLPTWSGRQYIGRTRSTEGPIMSTVESRRRSRRLELRTTPSERDLIERAVAVTETDLTDFVVTNAVDAARRVLADRDHFELGPEALAQWEQINARRTRDLPGLRRLMERPSPFVE